jgi:hypothetical protein
MSGAIAVQHQGGGSPCLHEQGFADRWRSDQDGLWKILIPTSERSEVLSQLDSYNLNSYLLFGSEDALMETIAERARRRDP